MELNAIDRIFVGFRWGCELSGSGGYYFLITFSLAASRIVEFSKSIISYRQLSALSNFPGLGKRLLYSAISKQEGSIHDLVLQEILLDVHDFISLKLCTKLPWDARTEAVRVLYR